MKMLVDWYRCARNALVTTIQHDGIEHAGYLAFLALLSMFPFLVFMVAVVGVLGQGAEGAIYITRVLQMLPNDVTAALQPRVAEIISGPPQGLVTVSILGAIWTASGAVEGMRTILNRAYHVATPPAYWFRRLLSIAQLLAATFLIISTMMAMVALPLLIHAVESVLHIQFPIPDKDYLSRMSLLISVVVLFAAVSSVYYFLPNIKQRFISVAPGAILVVALWLVAAYVFTIYLSNFNQMNLIYGSLGGIIAALVFFYICNMIFIFGAELNYQIVHMLGMRVEQKEEVAPEDDQNIK